MKEATLEARIKSQARSVGFDLVGIAPAMESDGFGHFVEWLDHGYAGEMRYLHKHRDHRRHPKNVLEPVRSVIMVSLEYTAKPVTLRPNSGRVAAYAQGPDYHRNSWNRLNSLRDWLHAEVPGSVAHGTTDSAPLLERDFARRAGLGWFGKNTMLINKHRGSFFFLGALLTNLELQPDPPHAASHCGTCTACLEACPTNAFPHPGVLDARRCISYLTIELRGTIPLELREGIGDWLFGCDVCQDVCPWNDKGHSPVGGLPHRPELAALDAMELLTLTEGDFRRRFGGTAIERTRRAGLVRNAAIVLGNVGDATAIPALEAATNDADDIVRDAASWALEQIRRRCGEVHSA